MTNNIDPILRKSTTGELTGNPGEFGTHDHSGPETVLPATAGAWDDITEVNSIVFSSNEFDDEAITWIEVCRTPLDDDDPGHDGSLYVQAGVGLNLESLVPEGMPRDDGYEYLDRHRNDIDAWFQDNYEDTRLGGGDNGWWDHHVLVTLDETDLGEPIPDDIRDIGVLVHQNSVLVELAVDLKDPEPDANVGARLRKHLQELDAAR